MYIMTFPSVYLHTGVGGGFHWPTYFAIHIFMCQLHTYKIQNEQMILPSIITLASPLIALTRGKRLLSSSYVTLLKMGLAEFSRGQLGQAGCWNVRTYAVKEREVEDGQSVCPCLSKCLPPICVH